MSTVKISFNDRLRLLPTGELGYSEPTKTLFIGTTRSGNQAIGGNNFITSTLSTPTINLTVLAGVLSAAFSSMNVSQFVNDSGYITSASAGLTHPQVLARICYRF